MWTTKSVSASSLGPLEGDYGHTHWLVSQQWLWNKHMNNELLILIGIKKQLYIRAQMGVTSHKLMTSCLEWWQLWCNNLGNMTSSTLTRAQNSEADVKMMQFLILICPMKLRCLWLSVTQNNSTGVSESLTWKKTPYSKLVSLSNKA